MAFGAFAAARPTPPGPRRRSTERGHRVRRSARPSPSSGLAGVACSVASLRRHRPAVVALADHRGPVRRHHGRRAGPPSWPPSTVLGPTRRRRRGHHARHARPGRRRRRRRAGWRSSVPAARRRRSASRHRPAARTRALLLRAAAADRCSAGVVLGLLGGVVLPWIAVAVLAASPITPPGRRAGCLAVAAARRDVAASCRERRLFFLASVGAAHAGDGPMRRRPQPVDLACSTARPAASGSARSRRDRAPTAVTRMICGFCSTGCWLDVHLRDGEAVNLTPTHRPPGQPGHGLPQGLGGARPRSRADDRATTPLLRDADGRPRSPSTGPTRARAMFATRIKAIQAEHGPESVAFLSTGQIPTEEMALLGALAKFGMGMRHGDGNTRQCMATVGRAPTRRRSGSTPRRTPTPTSRQSDVIVLVGSNLCIAHPIMWERDLPQPQRPRDRRHRPAPHRDGDGRHPAPRAPTQVRPHPALRAGPAAHRARLRSTATSSHAHTDRLRRVRRASSRASPRSGSPPRPGSPADAARAPRRHHRRRASACRSGGRWASTRATRACAPRRPSSTWRCMTGNIGRPGTGANSITGQCNAMGSRLFSQHHRRCSAGTTSPTPTTGPRSPRSSTSTSSAIPTEPSWAYDQIIEGISTRHDQGALGRSPPTAPTRGSTSRACASCSAGSTSSWCRTCTPRPRPPSWPTSCCPPPGWGEKEGTFINSERRLGLVKRVGAGAGRGARRLLDLQGRRRRLGLRRPVRARGPTPRPPSRILQRAVGRAGPATSPASTATSTSTAGAVQWPLDAAAAAPATGRTRSRRRRRADRRARLFADGRFFTPTAGPGSWSTTRSPPPERPNDRYPLVLLTGRGSSSQWHTETRTSKSAVAAGAGARAGSGVEIHPDDAARPRHRGRRRRWSSSRAAARCCARAHVVPTVRPGPGVPADARPAT